jgi:signal transduction histidine kinase
MTEIVHRHPVASDRDLVEARSRALALAAALGFPPREQTQIATAVSEVARNALVHAGGGEVEFGVESYGVASAAASRRLLLRIVDRGPGMPDRDGTPNPIGSGGMGLVSARRLVDHFAIAETPGGGTTVELGKTLPLGAAGLDLSRLLRREAITTPNRVDDPHRLIEEQNRQLLTALALERERQEELQRLSQELEETNRGVVALYSELDEKAEYLRRASELKTRFLSQMSHEFRTPLSSILALSRLLLDQVDGPLLPEQLKQVTYVRKSAEGLLELINDLLDLAKVEAGKLGVNCSEFSVGDLFGGLRGALRPLMTRDTVNITFEAAEDLPPLRTDEGKVAQILRNFIANAIRFTERGSIDVSARYHRDRDLYEFAVRDTGIGIAAADQTLIFDEFAQIDGDLQRQSRGTGLGLPLSKQLAELLGGQIQLASTVGKGSVFTLRLPRNLGIDPVADQRQDADRRLLVIDDEDASRYIIRQLLGGIGGLTIAEARTAAEGIARARQERPDAVILDVLMPDRGGQEVLRVFKADPELRDIPVLVTTAFPLDEHLLAELRDADGVLSKQSLSGETLRAAICGFLGVKGRGGDV